MAIAHLQKNTPSCGSSLIRPIPRFPHIAAMMMTLFVSSQASFAQTQLEINQKACQQHQDSDKELNEVYQKVIKRHKEDKSFIASLRKAQRTWVEYRDAHLQSIYPADDKLMNYGSVYPMCSCAVLEKMTRARTEDLKRWLDPFEEGEVCNGTRLH